jgi:hypothetical protein
MKKYEVKMNPSKPLAAKLGVKYPGRAQAAQIVEARTGDEATNKAQAMNPGYKKYLVRPI